MRKMGTYGLLSLAMLLLTLLGVPPTAQGQRISVLYNFGTTDQDPVDPENPGILAQGRDGNLFSSTPFGGLAGPGGYGTAFTITPQGTLTVLHNFDAVHASEPFSGLTLGTDGNFYGTTVYGGSGGFGTVFRMTPSGHVTALHQFSGNTDGGHPYAPPIEGPDGNFYGTTMFDARGNGTIYRITPAGILTTLFQFNGSNGSGPLGPLVEGPDGNFYGTTMNPGTVYQITPAGKLSTLHQFDCGQGCAPEAGLIQASDGNFYGTASEGGTNNAGVVYQITSAGQYTVIHNFNGTNEGTHPSAGLVQATDGNMYGVAPPVGGTGADGTVYKVGLDGSFAVINKFNGRTGNSPEVTLFQHTNGKLYGDAYQGGSAGYGTFYSVDLGLGPFVSLLPTAGRVGRSVGILGQGLTGTTGVSFNGTAARFRVVSDTYMTATVPKGATTGFVSVATPGGNLTSNQPFRILP